MCMDGSDRIVSMLYIRREIIASSTYYIITGKSISQENEHIKDSISDFRALKEELGRNKMICNKIQTIILLWKEDLKNMIEKIVSE